MNTKSIIAVAAFAALASGATFAQEADPAGQFAQQVQSTKTRADVQAELAAYKQAGVNPWSTSYNPTREFQSTKTRAQVQSEFIADRASVAALTSEDSGSAYLSQNGVRSVADTTLAGTPVRAQ
jgi:hypothetical protein